MQNLSNQRLSMKLYGEKVRNWGTQSNRGQVRSKWWRLVIFDQFLWDIIGTSGLWFCWKMIFSRSKIRYYRALWLKKWFDCAYLFTVILIYGRAVSTFFMTVSTFWFWFFIITRGACELVLGGMVTINVFFPFGELSSRLHPPKNQKTNSDHHFGKKEDCTSNLKEKRP